MRDLTEGPIKGHLIAMAAPIAAGMIFQTLYFLVDLYFVGRLGGAAIAGVGSAGNLAFLVMSITQVLGVGTVALISQAVGRKDQPYATLVFNQSSVMAMALLLTCLIFGYPLAMHFADTLGSDAATRAAGATYLRWYLPGLALQFTLVAMASALRGTGIVKPTMTVQMLTVIINLVLAPILIGGWAPAIRWAWRARGWPVRSRSPWAYCCCGFTSSASSTTCASSGTTGVRALTCGARSSPSDCPRAASS